MADKSAKQEAKQEYEAAKKKPPGEGSRFKAVTKSVAAHDTKGKIKDPKAVAAAIGRKKYGAGPFSKMAAAGKKKKAGK